MFPVGLKLYKTLFASEGNHKDIVLERYKEVRGFPFKYKVEIKLHKIINGKYTDKDIYELPEGYLDKNNENYFGKTHESYWDYRVSNGISKDDCVFSGYWCYGKENVRDFAKQFNHPDNDMTYIWFDKKEWKEVGVSYNYEGTSYFLEFIYSKK